VLTASLRGLQGSMAEHPNGAAPASASASLLEHQAFTPAQYGVARSLLATLDRVHAQHAPGMAMEMDMGGPTPTAVLARLEVQYSTVQSVQ
jgi:hypothetical protein